MGPRTESAAAVALFMDIQVILEENDETYIRSNDVPVACTPTSSMVVLYTLTQTTLFSEPQQRDLNFIDDFLQAGNEGSGTPKP